MRILHAVHSRLHKIIRQFTPNWFTVTMGTGILSLSLERLPHAGPAIHAAAELLWALNIGLFAATALLYAAHWILFFEEARQVLSHATMSLFLGAVPMGFATIVNGLIFFGGPGTLGLAQALWWLDAAMAVGCAVLGPYLMFTRQSHVFDGMTALWLMPVVACVVSAASGGLLLEQLPRSADADCILWLSYGLWTMSMLPAFSIQALLFLRMVLHRLPHRDMAATCWLSLGPIATGALGLITLGDAAPNILAGHDALQMAGTARALGVFGAALLWGYGAWWFGLAALITLRYVREGLPFNLGWWGFTFPLGNYALCTLALAAHLDVAFFEICGVGLVGLLTAVWVLVSACTIRRYCLLVHGSKAFEGSPDQTAQHQGAAGAISVA